MTILEGPSRRPDNPGNVRTPGVMPMAAWAPCGSTAVVAADHSQGPESCSRRPPSLELGSCSGGSGPDSKDPDPRPSGTDEEGVGADRLRTLLRSGLRGDWRDRARCAESDPELFYPEAREAALVAK